VNNEGREWWRMHDVSVSVLRWLLFLHLLLIVLGASTLVFVASPISRWSGGIMLIAGLLLLYRTIRNLALHPSRVKADRDV
jgi:uncharacterized membrane protein YfcA